MKRFSLVLVLALIVAGCVNPTPQKVAVTTLGSVHQAADTAYVSYIGLVLKGKLPEDNVKEVSDGYREFQKEFAIAVALVKGNTNSVVPPAVFQSQSKLLNSINKAKGVK
jgi:hypothetical protein